MSGRSDEEDQKNCRDLMVIVVFGGLLVLLFFMAINK